MAPEDRRKSQALSQAPTEEVDEAAMEGGGMVLKVRAVTLVAPDYRHGQAKL
jgi:hypothetical protein